jgi:ribosomal protein S18 acetylase RimI-like enzyme
MGVSPAGEHDRDAVVATLVAAFADDPVERWLYPGEDEYRQHFPEFVAAFGGPAFEHGTVWKAGECEAVAVWLPPGAEPDGEAVAEVLARTVAPDKHADLFAVAEQMDAGHPRFPHWYLPWLGTHPAHQNRGLGGELLRDGLARAGDLPAYLETPNPRTVPFYERHGFEVTGTAQAGACPPVTLMLRAAR